MSVLSLSGGLLLIICGALCGLYFAIRAEKRLGFLKEYESFLLISSSLVTTCQAELSQILEQATKGEFLSKAAGETITALSAGNDPRTPWKAAAADAVKKGLLCAEDEELIAAFIEFDGEEDITSRSGWIDHLLLRTRQRLEELKKETAEKRRLYRVIGTFAGALAAAILL